MYFCQYKEIYDRVKLIPEEKPITPTPLPTQTNTQNKDDKKKPDESKIAPKPQETIKLDGKNKNNKKEG